jgi:outer membrane protein OmpA-like peptidoglycan-associated protein
LAGPENPIFIKNIKIAAGGGDLYKRFQSEGKFISHGILFEKNKSEILPNSMGSMNEIVSMIKAHPELKLEIGGHTDNDGDDAFNLKLSQSRANAVKDKLISFGVDGSKLTSVGYGETKPLNNNNSIEDKANNRRVEFTSK